MSPLKIKILLHYFLNRLTTDAEFLTSGAPIVEETFADLVACGLLEVCCGMAAPTQYAGTDKLAAYVEMLLATPLPESAWIDPRTNGFVKRSA